MTQAITVQVGQCGNQIGSRFWDLALREHADAAAQSRTFDGALGSFFRNVDSRTGADLEAGSAIRSLKARALLIDMEEGVVNETMRGRLGELFDERQFVADVSGSGNNWAHGHMAYGPQYHGEIEEKLRKIAEGCDCLQSFFVMHSLGGGTGSGLGTYLLSLMEDQYPDVYRFTTAVFPSEDDDVITSPYNSVLAMNHLINHADCVLPIDNQALSEIVERQAKLDRTAGGPQPRKSAAEEKKAGFDAMNDIVAQLLLNLTSGMRFEGNLNVDLNEITMNLVPFPRLHFLVSSMAPLYSMRSRTQHAPRRLDQIFGDAFSRDYQLIKADPRNSRYLACGLMLRGAVEVSDVRRNIDKIQPNLKFAPWSQEGWKVGMCSTAPLGHPYSLLCLANNTCVKDTFETLYGRFARIYKRRAHIHHYTQYMDQAVFDEAAEEVRSLIEGYASVEAVGWPDAGRLKPL